MARVSQKYNTRLRPHIISAFSASPDGLLSASDVYLALVGAGVSVNLTTVYRNLERMTEAGELLRFCEAGERGGARYKYSGEGGVCRDHIHAKCTECGEVLHLDCDFMEKLAHHTQKEHGFLIRAEGSMLFGVCEKCADGKEGKQ